MRVSALCCCLLVLQTSGFDSEQSHALGEDQLGETDSPTFEESADVALIKEENTRLHANLVSALYDKGILSGDLRGVEAAERKLEAQELAAETHVANSIASLKAANKRAQGEQESNRLLSKQNDILTVQNSKLEEKSEALTSRLDSAEEQLNSHRTDVSKIQDDSYQKQLALESRIQQTQAQLMTKNDAISQMQSQRQGLKQAMANRRHIVEENLRLRYALKKARQTRMQSIAAANDMPVQAAVRKSDLVGVDAQNVVAAAGRHHGVDVDADNVVQAARTHQQGVEAGNVVEATGRYEKGVDADKVIQATGRDTNADSSAADPGSEVGEALSDSDLDAPFSAVESDTAVDEANVIRALYGEPSRHALYYVNEAMMA